MSPRRATEITRVPADEWRASCEQAQTEGACFGGLFAATANDCPVQLRALFSSPVGEHLIVCEPVHGRVESLLETIPAAAWDEREIHDLHQIRFDGHEPLRPLLNHQAALEAWTVGVDGQDPHQVAVGPVHAGVIESGHFRFHVVGERILHLDLRLFYKRRGLEAAAAGRWLADGVAYAQRACGACAVTNTVAYAQACEAALGLEPDVELQRTRTLLLELERLYNHLHDISAICAGVGFAPGTMAYAALKERAQRLNQRLTGHRFLFGTVTLATSWITLTAGEVAHARNELRAVREEHASCWRELQFAISLQVRLAGIGVVTHDDAERLGALGPTARAAGLRHDVRSESPRLAYRDFEPVTPPTPSGDVAARMTQRALELDQSLDLLEELLSSPFAHGRAREHGRAAPIGVGRVESPRGATVCVIERDQQHLRHLHLRTGSCANWPLLVHAIPGNLLPDFPLINKSFELCYACVDR